MTSNSKRYKRKADALVQREIDQELVVLNTRTGNIHQLNAVAACIWRELEHDNDLVVLAENVAQEFSVDKGTAIRDTEVFIAELDKLGLLEELE